MFNRLRSGALAGGGALLLILSISGMAMGASLTSDSAPADTSFVDIDGDGVADHCQTEAAVEQADVAQAAFDAADLNDDGEISVSEAAHSGWTGGENCNHGGYVSEVAQAGDSCEAEDTEEPEGTETGTEEGTETGTEEGTEEAAPEDDTTDCEAEDAEETEETEEAAADEETCEAVAAPEIDPATDTSDWNHGAWVSWVANSPATGGKNCNHGGAVSEASKAAKEAAKAAKEAARAERDAKKAEKKAARDLRKQERQAGKANKGHGKPN
jgi:hypothetical protein